MARISRDKGTHGSLVSADTYHVSPEPMLLIADLDGRWRLACMTRDAAWRPAAPEFYGGTGRPRIDRQNTLSSVWSSWTGSARRTRQLPKRDEVQAAYWLMPCLPLASMSRAPRLVICFS